MFFCADSLVVYNGAAQLHTKTIWGVLRGLESFSHLIYHGDEGEVRTKLHTIKKVMVDVDHIVVFGEQHLHK